MLMVCSLSAYSQQYIQNKFFGCPWNSSMLRMRDSLKNKNYSVSKENDNLLEAYNVRFGGVDWRFAYFDYFRDRLYRVSFSINFKTKSEMYRAFDYMRDQLVEKYKSYESIYINEKPDIEGFKHLFISDKCDDSVMLNCSHSRSNGGEMYYYLSLYYVYETLYEKAKDVDVDEL